MNSFPCADALRVFASIKISTHQEVTYLQSRSSPLLAARLPDETNLRPCFAQHLYLPPGLAVHVLERVLEERLLREDLCFPNMPWPLLVSLEADNAGNVEDKQAGVVACLTCQIQQPMASKIVEGRAVRHSEQAALQSLSVLAEICIFRDKSFSLSLL